MKSKIIWKLTACFAAVLILFTIVLGTVFVFLFRQHTISINKSSMEEKAITIAETLSTFKAGQAQSCEEGNENGGTASGNGKNKTGTGRGGGDGYGAYLRFLDELAMAEVWIVDEDLNMLSIRKGHTMISKESLPENAREIVNKVCEGEITYGEEFSGLLENPSLTVGAPIHTAEGIIGAVLVHSPVSGLDEAISQGTSALGVGVIAALLFAGIAAFLLSYGFTAPLRKMQTTALSLASGNYHTKTGVNQKDEIGALAQSIDLLSGHLSKAQEERETLDQLKQDFMANVSHELRTPVAVLRGSLEVLKDGTVNETGEVKEYYEYMLAESRHLERLVNDLLDLSRLQDDRFPLELEMVNLCDIIRDASRAIRMKAQEKKIDVIASCPEDSCMVRGDYGRIRQMVLILLDNAVKFSPEQETVELELLEKEGGYCIIITDYGIGISCEDLPFIFDRFKKNRSLKNAMGTGLGLPIARQIVERHHGVIQAESMDGITKFIVRFNRENT